MRALIGAALIGAAALAALALTLHASAGPPQPAPTPTPPAEASAHPGAANPEESAMKTPARHAHTVTAIAAAPDGARLVTGDMKGGVIVWARDAVTPIAALTPPDALERSRVRGLAFSREGRLAIATDWTGTVELWDGERFAGAIRAATGQVTAVAWTPDGALLTGGTDRGAPAGGDAPFDEEAPTPAVVTRWKGDTAERRFEGPTGMVGALAVSAEGDYIAAGVGEQVVVWRASGGEPIARFSGVGEVRALAFDAADGAPRLVAVGAGGLRTTAGEGFEPGPVQTAVKAPAAAIITADRVAAAGYDQIRIHQRPDLEPIGEVPGRAYAATAVGDALWIALADAVVRVDATGREGARHRIGGK
ncbi:MAG: hypothetical protein R3F65_25705 [bacterium]